MVGMLNRAGLRPASQVCGVGLSLPTLRGGGDDDDDERDGERCSAAAAAAGHLPTGKSSKRWGASVTS